MEREIDKKSEKLEQFSEMIKTAGFLCLPKEYATAPDMISVKKEGKSWKVRLWDQKSHLYAMPYLDLEDMYVKCDGKFDTEVLRLILSEYVKKYEKAEKEELMEGKLLSDIMKNFPEDKMMSILVPYQGGVPAEKFPGRHMGNSYMLYAVLLMKEPQIKLTAVTWQMLEKWEVHEEILYQTAKKNMPAIFPYDISEIRHPMGGAIYIVSSVQRCFGLGTLLYEESPLKELSVHKKDNLFVFPLSVHEAAVFPASDWQKQMLQELAEEISPFGRDVWYYSKALNRLAFTEEERTNFEVLIKYATMNEKRGGE